MCDGRLRTRSKGPVALDGDTLHHPALWVVVGRRVVLRGAVVPERDRAGLPTQPHLPLGMHRLLAQAVEQPLALFVVATDDPFGEERVDIQGLASGLRMCADDGMLDAREPLEHLGPLLLRQAGAEDVDEGM